MSNSVYLDSHDARTVSTRHQIGNGKRKVAMDVRVSTQHEMQINALGNQEQWALELARQHAEDWIFNSEKDLYVEEGISGTSLKRRPAFAEMIEKAKAGIYDLIVVREVCRFMRNARLTLDLVDDLKKCGVEVYFVNDGIWTFNEEDYFKLSIMAQYAEQESRKVSERVFSGQAIARANGILFGNGNILGYRHIKGDKSCDSTYVIDEEQAKTVRKIYELCIRGYGIKKIKNYLVQNGYKTAEGNVKWHDSSIQRILRKSTYMGKVEHFQSVTEDPLTHERVKVSKDKHIFKEGNFPPIIDENVWMRAQAALDSRVNHDFSKDGSSGRMNGICENKDIYCKKMRCGCGRRFKKDLQTQNNTSTYRCYQLVEDGDQETRLERSMVLEDNCCIYGIRDWKMNFFTKEVFRYLNCNVDEVKRRLLEVVEKCYVEETESGYSQESLLQVETTIERLMKRNENLLDMREEGTIDKEQYVARKKKNDDEIAKQLVLKEKLMAMEFRADNKESTLKSVKEFLDERISIPMREGMIVPEDLIETYVNSIKACANNVFEYNVRINSNARNESPLVVPDEEFVPSVHSAKKVLDNSDAVLIAEFTLGYDEAKAYANRMRRKVKRVHWEKPAVIRVYARI